MRDIKFRGLNTLMKYDNNVLDLVSDKQLEIGDNILIGQDKDGNAIIKTILNIHEQSKERGIYKDERNSRVWAKVSY